jgi:spermidine synthase
VALGIVPFSGLLGFLTPMLADRWSEGDPNRAGTAYAINVVGCILGPLVSGFLLVPWLGERHALVVLSLPWLAAGVALLWPSQIRALVSPRALTSYGIGVVAVLLVFSTHTFEDQFPNHHIQRDSTATVMAFGNGMQRRLLVNGIGMTVLTPITKMMSALPMTFLDRPPQNALVICFGMGTTHRSMLSWGIPSTVVELVPSVPSLFSYYHADGDEVLRSPRSRVVIDDGRRFLERSKDQFDVIVIDPPPPYSAAASGLLYSREFYSAAKRRLRPDGILQQWLPGDADAATQASVARALAESFAYVRVFASVDGPIWGLHFLASQSPIPNRTPAELAARMPATAKADLLEWGNFASPEQGFALELHNEVPIEKVLAQMPNAPAMRDDRPVNEYFLLRLFGVWLYQGQWDMTKDRK